MTLRPLAAVLLTCSTLAVAQEAAAPATTVSIPLGSDTLDTRVLSARGGGRHPAVVLLHGLPGSAEAPELATRLQAMGFTVVYPHYRGAWGSTGTFSPATTLEDGTAALVWLRVNAASLKVDPARISIVGTSYGGWVAGRIASDDPSVHCLAMLSPADLGMMGQMVGDPAVRAAFIADWVQFTTGATPPIRPAGTLDAMADGLAATAPRYGLKNRTARLAFVPTFISGGRADQITPMPAFFDPLVASLRAAKVKVTPYIDDGGHGSPGAATAAAAWLKGKCS